MNEPKILVVDDNPEICEIIRVLLGKEGFLVQEAQDGFETLKLLEQPVDLIILDVMMPDTSGFELCTEIRKITTAPILFLSAKTRDTDKELGFACGGDDYLIKPFSSLELIARVKALIRRYFIYQGKVEGNIPTKIQIRDLCVYPLENRVTTSDKEIRLTDIEYRILVYLLNNRESILSARDIYESIWQEPFFPISNNTIMVHIKNLRKKIEEDYQNPRYIRTVWGKGYRID